MHLKGAVVVFDKETRHCPVARFESVLGYSKYILTGLTVQSLALGKIVTFVKYNDNYLNYLLVIS